MSGKPFEGLGDGAVARGLAWAYGVGQRTHAAARLRGIERAGVPVISVGNLVAGGAGKTPLVAALAAHFVRQSPTAVLSRGYGGRARGPLKVGGDTDPALAGDEPVELARLVPAAAVWVARDRVAGAKAAVAAGASRLILDDGFAYRALHRDVDLLLFDERGLGNGLLLPAGPLREPASAMERAHAVVLRGDAVAPAGWAGPVFRMQMRFAGLTGFDGTPFPTPPEAVAAAGIAWPERFFRSLGEAGISLRATHALTDHAPWAPSLARRIGDQAGGLPVIVTGKDAVKLRRNPPRGTWLVAAQSADLDEAFWPWIDEHATLLGSEKA